MPSNYAKGFHFSTFCWHLLFFESFKTVAILMCIKYYLTHKGRFLILLSARERGKLCDENTQLGGFHLVKATRKSTWRKKWLIGGLNTRRALALYKVETKAFRKWGQEQLHCGSLNRAHPGVKEGQCGWGGSGRWTTGLANGLWFYPEHTGRPGGQLHQFSVLKATLAAKGFPGGSDGKDSACSAGDPGLIPGWGRSPGEGNGYPLQYSRLGNCMDRGA